MKVGGVKTRKNTKGSLDRMRWVYQKHTQAHAATKPKNPIGGTGAGGKQKHYHPSHALCVGGFSTAGVGGGGGPHRQPWGRRSRSPKMQVPV